MLDKLYEEHKNNFSKSDYRIMNCLMRNQKNLPYLTTESLAENLGLSTSTISRFWEKIGFDNIKEFKEYTRRAEYSTPASRTSSALEVWSTEKSHLQDRKVQYEDHIMRTLDKLDISVLEDAASAMLSARNVYVFATDAALGLADILAYRCNRLGIQLQFIKTGSGIYESMMNIGSRDLVILFSYSRLLSEVQILLRHARNVHYKTMLFTDLLASPEIAQADMLLYSYRGEPNEYHSMVAPMTLLDLLIMKLTAARKDAVPRAEYLEQLRNTYANFIKR